MLDVGASGAHLPGWISLDIAPDEAGIEMDASRRWPFPDGCARAVRSEHMVEHISYENARVYFAEAFRVLEPGGVLRTGTPDLEEIARARTWTVVRARGRSTAGTATTLRPGRIS